MQCLISSYKILQFRIGENWSSFLFGMRKGFAWWNACVCFVQMILHSSISFGIVVATGHWQNRRIARSSLINFEDRASSKANSRAKDCDKERRISQRDALQLKIQNELAFSGFPMEDETNRAAWINQSHNSFHSVGAAQVSSIRSNEDKLHLFEFQIILSLGFSILADIFSFDNSNDKRNIERKIFRLVSSSNKPKIEPNKRLAFDSQVTTKTDQIERRNPFCLQFT